MKKPDRLLADKLLEISAVKLQPEMPFVWGSGWNSPIYNDNRRILSYIDVRNFVKVEMSRLILEKYPDAEVVAAVSTSAIPFGTLAADALGLPFIYVRSTPKDHGLENLIEGDLQLGKKVVMVEDIVATGNGSLKAAETIRFSACDVLGGVCVLPHSGRGGDRHQIHRPVAGKDAQGVAPRPGQLGGGVTTPRKYNQT